MLKLNIPFYKPALTGQEKHFVLAAIDGQKLSGDGNYTRKCETYLSELFEGANVLLTSSCTHALEMCAHLLKDDGRKEVIMPSFTFVSSALAFVSRGFTVKFVDVNPHNMNMNVEHAIAAITSNTVAIVSVHYGGIAPDIDRLSRFCKKQNIYLIEDAAQAIGSRVNNRSLGTFGDLAALSFHDTKNITSGGEGGALIINNEEFSERAEIIREKGTNRKKFLDGQVDKYTWVDFGSSYLMSEIQAAYLYANLINVDKVTTDRLNIFQRYYSFFNERLHLEYICDDSYIEGNGHLFYFKVENANERADIIAKFQELSIMTPFHYIPLHSSPFGIKHCSFFGSDEHTTDSSQRLIRLPIFYKMTDEQISYVLTSVGSVLAKYGKR